MNYNIIKFKSGFEAYALREYFPYTDKPFFKSLDDLLTDDDFRVGVANLFLQLYKDELVFKFSKLNKHSYIVPLIYNNKKFSSINKLVCVEIAKLLQLEVLDDYFESINFSHVDIRDEYTKEDICGSMEIKEVYKNIPVVLFDCCCSTGSVINEVFNDNSYNRDSLFLVYGVRFNASELKNTLIESVEEYDYLPKTTDENKSGFLVKVYGLFGYKNVEVDFRNDMQIDIGENGFGKSSATRLALLALDYDCGKKEKTKLAISKYYFDKLDILYYGLDDKQNYCCALRQTINYDDMIISKEELLEANKGLLNDFLNSISSAEYRTIIRKIILDDRSIAIDYNNLNLKYRQKNYDFKEIDKVIRDSVKVSKENHKLIETLYFNKHYIYFNCAHYRNIVAKPPRDKIELFHYEENYDYGYEHEKEYDAPIDVDYEAKWERRCQAREEYMAEREEEIIRDYKRRDPFAFDYDDPDDYNLYYDGDFYDVEDEFDQEYEDDYDDDDYYDDEPDYCEEEPSLYEQIGLSEEDIKKLIEECDLNMIYFPKMYSSVSVNVEDFSDDSSDIDLFKSSKVSIHKIIEKLAPSHEDDTFEDGSSQIYTSLYSLLKRIFEYDEEIFNDTLTIEEVKAKMSIMTYLQVNKDNIEKLYKDIFDNKLEYFSFGIYDVIDGEEYNKLSKIINRLLTEGLKTTNDYFVVVGLSLILKEYNHHFKNDKHLLLEKLINKYLINKSVQVYANNMTIIDNSGNYIPLDRLSTGEKNLIIIFSLCLLSDNKFIILDEPDLSMSVDWQSKLLVDLLKYTTNRYIVVSQSPLLVQKNNLSVFVKRMDFSVDMPTISFDELYGDYYPYVYHDENYLQIDDNPFTEDLFDNKSISNQRIIDNREINEDDDVDEEDDEDSDSDDVSFINDEDLPF